VLGVATLENIHVDHQLRAFDIIGLAEPKQAQPAVPRPAFAQVGYGAAAFATLWLAEPKQA
jgi:hypothetical protein